MAGDHDADELRALRRAIVVLLEQRAEGKTICPSEAARAVGGERYRELMPAARAAAAELVAEGKIDVSQRGEIIDLSNARGPIRLRLRP